MPLHNIACAADMVCTKMSLDATLFARWHCITWCLPLKQALV